MRNPAHFPFILNLAMVLVSSLYISLGVVGYLKYGASICGSITLNLPPSEGWAIERLFCCWNSVLSWCVRLYRLQLNDTYLEFSVTQRGAVIYCNMEEGALCIHKFQYIWKTSTTLLQHLIFVSSVSGLMCRSQSTAHHGTSFSFKSSCNHFYVEAILLCVFFGEILATFFNYFFLLCT